MAGGTSPRRSTAASEQEQLDVVLREFRLALEEPGSNTSEQNKSAVARSESPHNTN
jgi:hypothetical protein